MVWKETCTFASIYGPLPNPAYWQVECCPELLLKEIVRSVKSSVLFFATRLEQVVDASSELQCLQRTAGHLGSTFRSLSVGPSRFFFGLLLGGFCHPSLVETG